MVKPRPSRATGRPRGRPPDIGKRNLALVLKAADPSMSISQLSRLVGISRERIRVWLEADGQLYTDNKG